ncbi:MAG: hypothetical protein M3Q58_02980 [Bacteroidota bacterium]|nr:hypothetical protein [Bacteroidota bacterium]
MLLGLLNLRIVNQFQHSTSYIEAHSMEQLILLNYIQHNAGLRKLTVLYYLFTSDQEKKSEYLESTQTFNYENNLHYKKLDSLIVNQNTQDQLNKVFE